ncbi:MAG: bifunctional alpha/beta hydrolase/OsmC family protein [Pseudomonadota bacterium]
MASNTRIEFTNDAGVRLSAALVQPDGATRGYALFAHCFTCSKNIAAASRISRQLAAQGIAVFRFDFTGLGNSAGDFGNTDFASNVDDLVAAARFMTAEYAAPDLLIGHSLGGAGVLAAAAAIPSAKAVVTLGAPASAEHVVERLGRADGTVQVGTERFSVDASFVADYSLALMRERIAGLRKALLVMHAPLDDTVSIEQAGIIFGAAKHPKSFITLDDADHLLSSAEDTEYVAQTLAAWSSRYLAAPAAATPPVVAAGRVTVGELNRQFLRSVHTDDHHWLADEPRKLGGHNLGPDPYEHLLAALGTCTSMTLRMYAERNDWPLTDVQVHLRHSREHRVDCDDCEDGNRRIEVLERAIELQGPLTDDQHRRLLQIANRCPVHRTLEGDLEIRYAAPGRALD